MKKWMIPVLLTALLCMLASPVLADEEKMTVSDAQVQSGQVVFLTVSLNESVKGDTVGISYSFDSALLEALPAQCSWSRTGILEDFGTLRNSGAWTASASEDLKGELCTLAFLVRTGVFFEETTVSCKVTVKEGSQILAEYTAQSTIHMICTHQFTDWKDGGALGHIRTCTICSVQNTQPHSWDDGMITDHPTNPQLKIQTFTCGDCGGQKVEEILEDHSKPSIPVITLPQQSLPTRPEVPNNPIPTLPGVTGNSVPGATTQDGHDHDHTHSDDAHSSHNGDPTGVIVVLLLVAVMVGAALRYVRKKR